MEEYRRRQKELYLERERARKEALMDVDAMCGVLEGAVSLAEALRAMERLRGMLREYVGEGGVLCGSAERERLLEKAGVVLGSLHRGVVKVDTSNRRELDVCERIKVAAREVLDMMGMEGAGEMEIEYDMDCSRDEEIARALAAGKEF